MRTNPLSLLFLFSMVTSGSTDDVRLYKEPGKVREEETVIAVEGAGSALDAVATARLKESIQSRTLDVGSNADVRGPALLSALAVDYKRKYGEALPIFISKDLAEKLASESKKATETKGVPGLDPSVPAPSEPIVRIGGKLHNVPIADILRYYANGLDCDVEIRNGMILFLSRQRPAAPTPK
jgi:hypothetical protein